MSEQIQPTERRFTLGYWLLLAGVILVVGFFIYPGIRGHEEGSSRIDTEMGALHMALAQYKNEFGAFPFGDTLFICKALTGNNPKSIRFIELRSVTPDGEFLDPWGTPYKIYYSGDWPLVRSAGPNKQLDSSMMQRQIDDYFGG